MKIASTSTLRRRLDLEGAKYIDLSRSEKPLLEVFVTALFQQCNRPRNPSRPS